MKKKSVFHHDNLGQFRGETHFVGGKQNRRKVRTVDGMEPDEFLRRNACDVWLHQEGHHDVLHQKEMERNRETIDEIDDDDEIPF
ncbi:hypothetical protein FEM03_23915 [Phragmitibacter flavus]|uniref:Uncharacterized protein n=1 Tax=Phragmitibacter flavus TaxID=2576071 RepID=A0A5R8K757_9BACT|nr:hypothetical protein [Phragmitibacter flavus]TLD68207.1 hypothetical protein FEM03_23915 [Phragmitibacter flavus]